MPGDIVAIRQRIECVANLSSMSRQPGQSRDLAVGGHASSGNAIDDGVDPRVAAFRRFATSAHTIPWHFGTS